MKNSKNIAIGARICQARKLNGISRAELAEQIGLSVLFIGFLETGEKGMSLDTLIKLSEVLHVSTDFILTGNQTTFSKSGCSSDSEIQQLLPTIPEEYAPLLKEQLQLFIKTIHLCCSNLPTDTRNPTQTESLISDTVTFYKSARNGSSEASTLSQEDANYVSDFLLKHSDIASSTSK